MLFTDQCLSSFRTMPRMRGPTSADPWASLLQLLRRHDRRSDLQGQAVFLWRLHALLGPRVDREHLHDSRFPLLHAECQGFIDLSSTPELKPASSSPGRYLIPTRAMARPESATPFANNQIPVSRVNPVSLSILQNVNAAAAQYGKLNATLPMSEPGQQLHDGLPFTKSTDSFDTKIDFTLNEKNHIADVTASSV